VKTPSLPSSPLPPPSPLRNSPPSKIRSLNWEDPLNNPWLMTEKLKLKPKSISKTSSVNSPNKEKTCIIIFINQLII
jgi:hypothetical protein